jgi:phosphatidate cytidylyltransferase
MLSKRLIVGPLLALLGVGLLIGDAFLAPYYPVLLATTVLGLFLSCYELVRLLPEPGPRPWLCYTAVVALALANWPAHLMGWGGNAWHWVFGTFVVVFMVFFLAEGEAYRKPGGTVVRLGLSLLVVCYLGVLPAFVIQLRWLPLWHGTIALAMAIFVPKLGDVGAYFVGRAFGRNRMTPVLSPGKTWEGFAGGLSTAVLVTFALNALSLALAPTGPVLSWWSALGFGISVGVMGVLGDLMESLIKRDCEKKDASDMVPGYGGFLDVLDSILFSAPVAYAWFAMPYLLARTPPG